LAEISCCIWEEFDLEAKVKVVRTLFQKKNFWDFEGFDQKIDGRGLVIC
jgi:hypothetical protein